MIRPLSICFSLAALAALSLPGLAPAQTQDIQADVKLQLLEAKLQALLAEIHAMRGAPPKPAVVVKPPAPVNVDFKVDEKKPIQLRVTLDGDKVMIVDAASGKVISHADTEKAIRLAHSATEKGEKKVMILGDDKKLAADAKTERKVLVFGQDGKEVKGEKKVVVVNAVENQPDTKAGTTWKVVELADPQLHVVRPQVATPAKPAQPGAAIAWSADHKFAYAATSAAGGDTLMLSRTTYSLPAAKAKALEAFLKENAKAKVLETKLDGDKLTVTTTPEVQHTIGGLIALMADTASAATYRLHLTQPAAPK